MAVEPKLLAVTTPFEPETLLMVATTGFCEDQVAEAVISCVVLSENVAVAANCNVAPRPKVGLRGVTAMAVSVFTARTVDPETPRVALTVVEPVATAVARPRDPTLLLIDATPLLDELQAANVVKSWTEPSGKAPLAVNCRVEPATALGLAGVMVMVAGPCTVSVVAPETPAKVALIVVEPGETEEASPPALIVATALLDELQLTRDVTS